MNSTLTKSWDFFKQIASSIIVKEFAITNIFSLCPPAVEIFSATGCTTSTMMCSSSKKSTELGVLQKQVLDTVPITKKKVDNSLMVISRPANVSQNACIHLITYDFLNTSILLPSQEICKTLQ